jgi:Transposase DDE domain group 1
MEKIAKAPRPEKPVERGKEGPRGKANKVGATTRYDFEGGVLTPYGGLLPLAALLEKLEFLQLVWEKLTVQRQPASLSNGQFVMGTVLMFYLGFARLHHVRYVRDDEMVQEVLGSAGPLPVQSTFWRFLASLHLHNEEQLMGISREMVRRVWEAGPLGLKRVHVDTDSTVNPVYGGQMGGRKAYHPGKKGKKSVQPLLSFVAETGECLRGKLHNGYTPTGEQMAEHITAALRSVPGSVREVVARADAGFYCKEVVAGIEGIGDRYSYILSADKTTALVRQLEEADWKQWAGTAGVCEFRYEPMGWGRPRRFVAVRYRLEQEPSNQYQLFATEQWKYRVFVTNRTEDKRTICREYDGRATAENYIKEGCNDAGFAVLSGRCFEANQNYLQMAILAYNCNRWLQLMALAPQQTYQRTQLRTNRLRWVFIAAKLVLHEGQRWIRLSQTFVEKELFGQLMERLRSIQKIGGSYTSNRAAPLTARVFT